MNVYRKPVPSAPPKPKQPSFLWPVLLLCAIGGIFIIAQWEEVDFLQRDKDGNPIISKKRQEKLEKELEELDQAEQYVLQANKSGYFPCYSCTSDTLIYLIIGEVWRYGTTTKGLAGRYQSGLPIDNLAYLVQFEGTLQECLKEEKRKIYNYAVLPENLKRNPPLIRPPGNKQDR